MGLALPYTHVPLVSDFNVPHDNSETMVGGIPESMGPGRGGCALGMTLRAHVATVTCSALSPSGLITQRASDLLPPPPPRLLNPSSVPTSCIDLQSRGVSLAESTEHINPLLVSPDTLVGTPMVLSADADCLMPPADAACASRDEAQAPLLASGTGLSTKLVASPGVPSSVVSQDVLSPCVFCMLNPENIHIFQYAAKIADLKSIALLDSGSSHCFVRCCIYV